MLNLSDKKSEFKYLFPKLPTFGYETLLLVFWTDAKRSVLNLLLDSYYIIVEENTKLLKNMLIRNFYHGEQSNFTEGHPWVQGVLTTVHPWAQGFVNMLLLLRVLPMTGLGYEIVP